MCLKCDGCLNPLSLEVNYLMRIEFVSSPDSVVSSGKDSFHDGLEIIKLLRQINNLSKEEMDDSVYSKLEYRICSTCYNKFKKYLLLITRIDDEILKNLEEVYL